MGLGLKLRITNTRDNSVIERTFDRFPVRIGRNQLNDMMLDFPFVSQFHAVLELTNGALMLRDLGSKNGTLLRGTGRVPPNTVVNLSSTNYEFAIVTLIFQASPVQVDATQPTAKKRHGTVLSMSLMDASALGQAAAPVLTGGPGMPMVTPAGGTEMPHVAQLKPLYDAYRAAWANIYTAVYSTAGALDPASRGQFLKRVTADLPALVPEPDFQRLAAHFGASVAPPQIGGGAVSKEEAVALQGLKELAQWYLPGGRPLEGVPNVVAFLQKLQDTLDVFLKCFVPLRDGYKQFEKDFNTKKTYRPGSVQAMGMSVETARDPKELAAHLLDWSTQSNEGQRTIESTFADLMIHQVAMLNGVMKGVKSLLAELSPAQIERTLDDPKGKKAGTGIFANRFKALWELYAERHSDLADEEKEAFGLIFGPQFVSAYTQLAGEGLGGKKPAPGTSMSGANPVSSSSGAQPAVGGGAGFPQQSSGSMPPRPPR